MKNHGIHGKLSGRKELASHICLDFAVELFHSPVFMIQFYDAAVRQINAAVIYVGLEVHREKVLAFFVDGPLCDLVDRSYANRFVGALIRFFRRGIRDLIGHITEGLPCEHCFSITGSDFVRTYIADLLQKGITIHPATVVAFENEVYIIPAEALFHEDPDVPCRIVAGIQTEQQGCISELAGTGDQSADKIRRPVLAVLFAFPEFHPKEIPFLSNVCKDGGKAVLLLIGTADPFLFTFLVDKRGYVDIYNDVAFLCGCQLYIVLFELVKVQSLAGP